MEYIIPVAHALFWIGIGLTIRSFLGWLRSKMKDDEILYSWTTVRNALDTTKDGKK